MWGPTGRWLAAAPAWRRERTWSLHEEVLQLAAGVPVRGQYCSNTCSESASATPTGKPPASAAAPQSPLQLSTLVRATGKTVTNMRDVYQRCKVLLERRQHNYQQLFDSVEKHVSTKFMSYMQRRKFRVRLRERPAGLTEWRGSSARCQQLCDSVLCHARAASTGCQGPCRRRPHASLVLHRPSSPVRPHNRRTPTPPMPHRPSYPHPRAS